MRLPFRKLFDKLGIKGFEELKPHEKVSYERWEKMLSAETNIDELRKFLINELDRLRLLREEDTAIPGDRVDVETLAQIRAIKGMLGQYAKVENLKKQAEAEIENSLKKL